MYDLQERVALVQSEISSLREQINKDPTKKLALKHKVHVLKNNLKNQDKNVELRAEDSRQLDRYDKLWKAHEVLLEETQGLHSRIIFLSSGGQVEGSGEWHGGTNHDRGAWLLTRGLW